MGGRNLNGGFNRGWSSLNGIHLNHSIKLGGSAGVSLRKSYVTGEACWRLVEAPVSVTLSLPFFPLSQYPNNPSFIRSFPKGLLHILILGKLHSPSKSFLQPFPKSVFPNKTQW